MSNLTPEMPPPIRRRGAQPIVPWLRLPRPVGVRQRASRSGTALLSNAALGFALLLTLPVLSVALTVLSSDDGTLAHLTRTVLSTYVFNTVVLVVGVALGVFAIGTTTAWLVTQCAFPGRRIFEWALIVPLAFPAYIIAYAYTDLLSHPGLVQSTLRDVTGWGPRDYWFPNVRSLGGAVAMFTLVLYPYVYLLARAAFQEQSSSYSDVARALGRSQVQTFFRVSLPLARPAIAGGMALALMETLADFGTVSHFGVQTFATGIYRAWYSMDDLVAAGHLATILLCIVLLVVLVERAERRKAEFHNARGARDNERAVLRGWHGGAAFAVCLAPVLLGFVLPLAVLINLHVIDGHDLLSDRYLALLSNSVILAGLAGLAAVAIAVFLTYAQRFAPGWRSVAALRMTNLGYAVPGFVIAIGILVPLGVLDAAVDRALRASFGVSSGLLLSGSVFALIIAYLIRFLAVANNAVEASLSKITDSMDTAARVLGSTRAQTLWRVHLPLMSSGLLSALLIVFVDVMKELPATLILRPFNFDTLAIQAYRLASDERLAQAATPSLVLVAVGLIPVIILSRRITAARVGRRR
ncbi:MAG: iron ABC transporter permease [Pseudomonadota bacterium]